MDNVDTPVVDNIDTQETVVVGGETAPANPVTPEEAPAPAQPEPTKAETFSWKNHLKSDLKDSPFLSKFDDSTEGLAKAMESYGNLEKLLGHEKVPIPKGAEDTEGWERFSKAMGIPDKPDGYDLPDANLPESMQGMTIDKNKFAEIVHTNKLTPEQAKGLWDTYQEINIQAYNRAMDQHQAELDTAINALRSEWGDSYDVNVELGQMVINKFTDGNQEANDYITSVLSKNPEGIKFLSKIGSQFAENKVGEFQIKRFSLAPEQAQEEIDKITRDPQHPYNNPNATEQEHRRAVDYVNSLYAAINRARG